MEVMDCIKARRSIRKFKDQPVKWDDITKILESAKYAPTSGNIQNFRIVVVQNTAIKKRIADACYNQSWMEQAPVLFVIGAETEKAKRFYGMRGERLYTVQNCAAIAENMLLSARDSGLGTCWV